MHIPSGQSHNCNIMTFSESLACSGDGVDHDCSRWLYVPGHYCDYRYILGTRGANPLICIGINPSTAEPGNLDNTLKSVERIALGNGFDSFVMFNVYAQRATRPGDMDLMLNPHLHQENMAAFKYCLANAGKEPAIWAAWGTLIDSRPYLRGCLHDMAATAERYGARWFTAGARSRQGHPHHPLYLRKDSTLDPFPIDSYV